MTALGLPIETEAMVDTPGRFIRAYLEMLTVPEFEMTTFGNNAGYDQLVVVRDIPVRSGCERRLLPFVGVAHVGYLPARGSSGCRSSPAPWSSSPGARRPRSG